MTRSRTVSLAAALAWEMASWVAWRAAVAAVMLPAAGACWLRVGDESGWTMDEEIEALVAGDDFRAVYTQAARQYTQSSLLSRYMYALMIHD